MSFDIVITDKHQPHMNFKYETILNSKNYQTYTNLRISDIFAEIENVGFIHNWYRYLFNAKVDLHRIFYFNNVRHLYVDYIGDHISLITMYIVSLAPTLETLIVKEGLSFKLDDSLSRLFNLKVLIIPDNNIKEIPYSFRKLTNLETLIVNNNKEFNFESDILRQFKNLRVLDISFTNVKDISNISEKVQILVLRGLTKFLIPHKYLPNIFYLDMSNSTFIINNDREITESHEQILSIREYKMLRVLNMSDCKFMSKHAELKIEISKLNQWLYASILILKNLFALNISDNHELSNLIFYQNNYISEKMMYVNLRNNSLMALNPINYKLKILDISGNGISVDSLHNVETLIKGYAKSNNYCHLISKNHSYSYSI